MSSERTDPKSVDTYKDGLSDQEELHIYGSDPLNKKSP
ncbi:MAG: hypothetical protein ACFFAU_03505 [Candidatus Hodarchaeota archaeon]